MKGKVYLIGAGPGDYKLITYKGIELIREADVLVYDRLVNSKFLTQVKPNCELIYVGKEASNHTLTQDEINETLFQKANEGKLVARLKGGDPYVFGRGGEEAEFLYNRNIEFEVIPGISSVIGGLAYAGIPITHRDIASSFHVLTGHLKENGKKINWKTIASLEGTLVFVMGMKNINIIVNNLINEGKKEETPVAIINWATRHNQKVLESNLKNVCDDVTKYNIKSPSLIVVGEVVTLRDKLNFFEKKSLFGKNIVVTRSRAQNSRLIEIINELGGNAIEFPTIQIIKINQKQLAETIKKISDYTMIIFTSQNAVKIFFEIVESMQLDSRYLNNIRIVSIGKITTNMLNSHGIIPDFSPKEFNSKAIYQDLKSRITERDRIFIPRSKKGKSELVDTLSKLAHVSELHIYDTICEEGTDLKILNLINENKIDYITFTSSSTVENFISLLGTDNKNSLHNTKVLSIGPITSKTIRNNNLNVYKEAIEHTIDGIINCLTNV